MRRLALIAVLAGGAAVAQTMNGPMQQGADLSVGQEAAPAGRSLGAPGSGAGASAGNFGQAPVTGLGARSPLVPRPAPGGIGPSEAARLGALPSVQTTGVYASDRDGDGASAEGLEPGNYARGELVAMGAGLVQNAGNACITCHGIRGAGDGSGAIPRMAGLPAWYIAKQLDSYAEGTRKNDVMQQIAGTLTRQDRLDVATYYAALTAPLPPRPGHWAPDLLQHGAEISSRGYRPREIPGCENCHAIDGAGLPPDVPYLQGQYASYIEAQLRAWQDGRRTNDEGGVMRAIAAKMTDRDIEALGAYFESLRPVEAGR